VKPTARVPTLSCSSEPGSLPAAAYKTKTQWREMIHAGVTGCKRSGTSLWKLQPLQKVLLSIASQVRACCNKNSCENFLPSCKPKLSFFYEWFAVQPQIQRFNVVA
jgi:hypothetical protein